MLLPHRAGRPVQECGCIQGVDPVIVALRKTADRLARANTAVAVTGESGTGRKLFARHIHQCAGGDQAFLRLDGGDASEARLNDAIAAIESPSRVVRTLFVDDLSSLPLDWQKRLLAVIGAAKLGGVRIVVSLRQPLQHACDAGLIAPDLVARFAPVEVAIPPLRERRSDIPVLVEYFLNLYSDRHALRPCAVDREALVHLWEHDWPGNVRELETVIERVAVVRQGGTIHFGDLPVAWAVRGPRRSGAPGAIAARIASPHPEAVRLATSLSPRDR